MRIISGYYKGRKINPPGNLPVRPTTDYAKEGIFNVLNNLIDFSEITVLDLFAGTGNISFEFASRGALSVLAVDIERRCVDYINQTADKFGMEGIRAIRMNVLVLIKIGKERADVVFADPPYEMEGNEKLPDLIIDSGMLNPGGLLILEHSDKYEFSGNPSFYQLREYGKVHFSIFRGARDEGEVQYSSS
ncbi:MAG: RsmD family RNA methyltransferase [Bacteroidales bacterium]|nr:RsmD family RNA methyltransferase [Bacteroidales bacterium]